MKLSFSLNKPKQAKPPQPTKQAPAFTLADDDDDHTDAAPTTTTDHRAAANKKLVAQNVQTSKAARKRLEAEQKVDATVYEYDEVWDKMQEAKEKQKVVKEQESKERKPKYINGLLQFAATRKLDRLRAEEKMMQHEREMEGDEFKDKDAFVTQAYKDQMAEVRAAEEAEKKLEEERKKGAGSTSGMAHFYRQLLQDSEAKHDATVAATQKPTIGPQGPVPNLTIAKPPELQPKSDLQLAHAAKEKGMDIELNDDNQIVDKRELLSAGLNLSGTNTRKLGSSKSTGSKGSAEDPVQAHRAVGTAASCREINERRAREIRRQMEEEEERTEKEKEQQATNTVQRTALKRNNDSDVQSARERYLTRKRQKLEEQEQATEPS